MSEYIEHRFNSVPTGEVKMNLINTEVVLIGGGRQDHVRHNHDSQAKRFFVPEKLFERMLGDGFTKRTYPDWETYAHWEDIETANEAELSSPELLTDINGKDIILTHFNARLRFFGDRPDATHVEYFDRGKCLGFFPDEELKGKMFTLEYPAVYMSTIDLDPDTAKWMEGQNREAA